MMVVLICSSIVLVSLVPQLPEIPELANTFWLFGIAMDTVLILLMISAILIYRWHFQNRKNNVLLIWAVSFALFTLPFIGMMLKAWGFPWANDSDPVIFFMFRQPMILFAAGMYYGIAKILTKSKPMQVFPTWAILLVGYMWFIHGLLVVGDVEFTMYGFLYSCFVPVVAIIAYSFYMYARDFKLYFPQWLAMGFAWLGVTYLAWAPWHKVNTYLIWFFLFLISLVFIAIGFAVMLSELRIKKGKKI